MITAYTHTLTNICIIATVQYTYAKQKFSTRQLA